VKENKLSAAYTPIGEESPSSSKKGNMSPSPEDLSNNENVSVKD